MRRALIATTLAVLLSLLVASATTLGTFASPILSASSGEFFPCTYEAATPLDGAVNLLTTVSPTSEITHIELRGVTGGCEGLVPIAIVEGRNLVTGDTEVLFVIDQFTELTTDDPGTVMLPLTSHIALGELGTLLYEPTNVRMAFCPGGVTCM